VCGNKWSIVCLKGARVVRYHNGVTHIAVLYSSTVQHARPSLHLGGVAGWRCSYSTLCVNQLRRPLSRSCPGEHASAALLLRGPGKERRGRTMDFDGLQHKTLETALAAATDGTRQVLATSYRVSQLRTGTWSNKTSMEVTFICYGPMTTGEPGEAPTANYWRLPADMPVSQP
jgi:hypothetical protein